MSEPPWDQGRSSDQSWPQNQGGPDQDRSSSQPEPSDQAEPSSWPAGNRPIWPSADQPPEWPSGNQPPAWPSGDQPPAWPSGNQPPAWPSGDQPPAWPSGDQPPAWPSGDQPPAWPSAGSAPGQQPFWPAPDQAPPPSGPPGGQPPPPSGPPGGQPPPSGPPGGQPPYPRPGYAYGYGPRLPRFARRPRFLGPIIVLGLFIVVGFVVRHVTSHENVAVTTFPSASGRPPAGQAQAGTIGSAFNVADGKGNVLRVTLVRVIDPARGADQLSSPDRDKRFVGLVFRIKALTGSPQDEDANNDAVVVGGNGQTYSADFQAIAGSTNFDHGAIHVAQGETATGSVTFQVPNGVKVSEVRWTELSGFGSTVQWNAHG